MHAKHSPRPNLQACKDGTKRKGKATHTHDRMLWTIYFWRNLRQRLRNHLKITEHGEATRIAQALGTSPSQIHRWSCNVCNHDQEPSFSIGSALLLYLESYISHSRTRTYTLLDITVTKINKRKRK